MSELDAELLAAWSRATTAGGAPFTVPGHKGRAGAVWPELGALLAGDVPLYGGLATVKEAPALLAAAEARAAALWGADRCRFVTGGSTETNQVVALALGTPGDTVLVGRNAHRSTVSGLIMAGLRPVWLPMAIDAATGLPAGLDLAALAAALDAHPEAVAVLCVDPSYVGTMSDLPAVAGLAHGHDVPLVVDQAWAGHLGFHPGYPPHALAAGADALVTSAHKTLPAYTQASLVLTRGRRLRPDRLDRAADLLATTSPAGSIVAGIDAARALLGSPTGRGLLDRLLGVVAEARSRLRAAGLGVPDLGRSDPAKLVIGLPAGDGLEVEQALISAGMPVEQADRDWLVPIVTMIDDAASVSALVDVIVATAGRGASGGAASTLWAPPLPQVAITPREAFFAPRSRVGRAEAVGRVSAELIAPYPPGIPVLAPGETVTVEVLDALEAARAAGTRIAYAADPTLATLEVVAR